MQKLAEVNSTLSVAPQIAEADLGELAARGFRGVINNRPDGEAADQPPAAVIEAAARRHGLDYRHIPVVSGSITEADVAAFAAALAEMKGPLLAFCRTGTRSITLWALAEAQRRDAGTILGTAAAAGYNLEPLRAQLELRRRSSPSSRA